MRLGSLTIALYAFISFAQQGSYQPVVNIYISPKNCRGCFKDLKSDLRQLKQIDTLFVVSQNNNLSEQEHLLYLIESLCGDLVIKDTVFGGFNGSIFSEKTKTNFDRTELNELFYQNTPYIFTRDSNSQKIIRYQP